MKNKKNLIKLIITGILISVLYLLINLNIKFSRLLLIILIGLSIYLGMLIKQNKNSGKQEEEVQTSSPENSLPEGFESPKKLNEEIITN